MSDTDELDARGLFCPEPVFKTDVKLKEMNVGETLIVKADDPSAQNDMEIYCSRHGCEIKNIEESENGEFTFTIYKAK
jgi:TusA-related sulfurtransferase